MKITDAMALAAAKEIKKQSGSTCEFGETCDWCTDVPVVVGVAS